MPAILINAAIFLTTFILLILCFRKEGRWQLRAGLASFRFFTILSNGLCAVGALTIDIGEARGAVPGAAWLLKYLGTVAVTVTLLTVLLFLGPTQGGYKPLLSGSGFYFHLLGPLLAAASFCLWEKGDMAFSTGLWGLVPVALYGLLYLYKVVYAPEARRWEDFYGFNRSGKWPIEIGRASCRERV